MLLRIFILTALLSGFASSQTLRGVTVSGVSLAPAGCGTYGDHGQFPYDQSLCGNVGNPYTSEGSTDATAWRTAHSATVINACPFTMTAGNYYQLGSSITAAGGDGNQCGTAASNAFLDGAGFTINGTLYVNGNMQGLHVFNLVSRCTLTDGARHGCIELDGGGEAITSSVVLHHINVKNLQTNQKTFGIYIDWSSALSTTVTSVVLYNITGALSTCTADGNSICTRTDILRMNGSVGQTASLEMYNTYLPIPSDVNNGQGLELYQVASPFLHNNYGVNLNPPVGFEGRFLDADGDTSAVEPAQGSNNAQMYNNYCIANSARCFRVRSSQSPDIAFNYMASITGTPGSNNAVHICDGGASSQTEAYTNAFVRFNTFEMAGGAGIFARWCTGYLVTDNNIKATTSAGTATGQFGYMNGTSGTLTMTFTRNANTLSPTSINVLNSGAAITTCNSGTVTTSGGGTNPTTTC